MYGVLLLPANEVWGKVIFSVACVKNSVHGGGIPACLAGGIPACLAGLWGGSSGPHPGRGVSRPTPREGGWQTPLPADGYCCGRYAS